jgi:antitoxin PrlF
MTISLGAGKKARARITSQGQITIPKAVRDALEVRPGDEVEFEASEDGFLIRHSTRKSILDFAGIAGKATAGIPQTAEELDRVIASGMSAHAVSEVSTDRKGRAPR